MADDNRRIALAALAVTAIVGVAAPVASNVHDNNRLHREQAQANRTELRSVLDEAAGALYVLRARFDAIRDERYSRGSTTIYGGGPVRVGSLVGSGRKPPRPVSRSELSALRRRLDRARETSGRVVVRLGSEAEATKQMARAIKSAAGVYYALGFEREQDLTYEHNFRVRTREYSRQVDRFVEAANRVARSTPR